TSISAAVRIGCSRVHSAPGATHRGPRFFLSGGRGPPAAPEVNSGLLPPPTAGKSGASHLVGGGFRRASLRSRIALLTCVGFHAPTRFALRRLARGLALRRCWGRALLEA